MVGESLGSGQGEPDSQESRSRFERFERKKLPTGLPKRTSTPFFYIDKERLTEPTREEKEIAQQVRASFEEGQPRLVESIRKLEVLPPKEIVSAWGEVNQALGEYYGELGVDEIRTMDEVIYIPDNLREHQIPSEMPEPLRQKILDPNLKATSYSGFILVKIPEKMPDDAVNKELFTIRIKTLIAHEGYHSVAPEKVEVRGTRKEDSFETPWQITPGRSGLAYYGVEGRSALEEGLAVLFQARFRDLLPKSSSLEPWYLREIDRIADEHNIPRECFVIISIDNKNENMTINHPLYPQSVRLVRFLQEELEKWGHDFRTLAEEARTHQKTVSLAKAVENVFGKRAYRMVALATENTAQEVLEELRGISHQHKGQ